MQTRLAKWQRTAINPVWVEWSKNASDGDKIKEVVAEMGEGSQRTDNVEPHRLF